MIPDEPLTHICLSLKPKLLLLVKSIREPLALCFTNIICYSGPLFSFCFFLPFRIRIVRDIRVSLVYSECDVSVKDA